MVGCALILAQVVSVSALHFPFADAPAPGTAREVAPGVHWLRMPLPFALNHINLWLLEDEGGWTMVDTGLGDAPTRALWECIFPGVLAGKPVRRVLVTHYHPDHTGNAGWLCARTGAPLWMTQGEYLTTHAVREGLGGYVPGATLALFRANGLDDGNQAQMAQRGNLYRRQVPEFPEQYRRIMDGERLAIGGHEWRVVVGYGHAPEHASLYCEALELAITGDMLLPKISTNVSVWPIDPEGDPLGQFLHSIRRYLELPAATLILPSHGLPFRGAHARVAQLQAHHEERLAELLEACRESPRCAADVLELLFRRKLDAHQMFFAMGEAIAHLHFLERTARLQRAVGADGVARFAPTKEEAWKTALMA
jgi:glyoxylase-like metal-dependent hydrolase (beta-lactamase superfamily II)